jgi:hypothetical protein
VAGLLKYYTVGVETRQLKTPSRNLRSTHRRPRLHHPNVQSPGKELFEAGQTLLEKSGLANFSNRRFVARNDEQIIERDWAAQFDPRFGRYMAWVLFVVGAENLAKAACVCSNVINVSSKTQLEHYVGKKKYFKTLCANTELSGSDKEHTLITGYTALKEIRNRDAHSYRRNKRRANFSSVNDELVPAFNTLLEAMEHGGHRF